MRLGVEAALVDGTFVPGDVSVEDGRVAAVGLSGGGRGIAAPGFVDLQVNGFAGAEFLTADAAAYERAGAALLATGTTAFQPTFVSAPEPVLLAALRTLASAVAGGAGRGARAAGAGGAAGGGGLGRGVGPRVLGAHVEGPFLARAGTHDPDALRTPDLALLRRLLAAGPVSMVTLAPELPGADALIDELAARGITVSAGHTEADAAQAHAAFDRGVRTVTHLFNAMRPSTSRDPSLAFAALARADVSVQLIADLEHIAPDTLMVAWQAARGRVALVSDAAPAAGLGDGTYTLGGRTVEAKDGVVRGPDGQLAGSAISLLDAVRNVHGLGIPLEDALTAASTTPARIVDRPDLGTLAPGAPADIVVLDDRLDLLRVLVAGSG